MKICKWRTTKNYVFSKIWQTGNNCKCRNVNCHWNLYHNPVYSTQLALMWNLIMAFTLFLKIISEFPWSWINELNSLWFDTLMVFILEFTFCLLYVYNCNDISCCKTNQALLDILHGLTCHKMCILWNASYFFLCSWWYLFPWFVVQYTVYSIDEV